MKMVGFDRRIRLEWLDEVAFYYHKTRDPKVCAEHMKEFMGDENPGAEARRKFYTVLKRIWVEVPHNLVEVRDRGLELLISANGLPDRIAVHYGMILTAYPFFRDVTEVIGQSLAIQDEISLAHIHRRTIEQWGERPTVKYALTKLTGSLWQWGVLVKEKAGTYSSEKVQELSRDSQLWLMECLLRSLQEDNIALFDALTSPILFPFQINITKDDLSEGGIFELSRQGLNMDILTLNGN